MGIRAGIKQVCRWLGYDVKRMPPGGEYGWVRAEGIRTVLDIGANKGQFASRIHHLLPDARIYCFEPLDDCYAQLCGNLAAIPKAQAFNFALGDTSGEAVIHRNDFSPSSSLLPVEELHVRAFPGTGNTRQQQIQIRRLDEVAAGLELTENVLIKMDVQGFEDKVVLGGRNVIAAAHLLIVETTFRPLYKGQPLFDGIYDLLRSMGFAFMGCEESLRSSVDGVILQSDSIFMRRRQDVDPVP